MAGMAGAGMGLGIMGGILGGVGDIISSQNYQRPSLPEATGREKRLRDLAQSQLLGAGQQTLGATALYNQLAPVLLGQLPGMSIRQAAPVAGGVGGAGPIQSYQQALQNFQSAQAQQQRLTELNARLKGAKKGPEKRAIRQERKTLQQQIKGSPTVAERERQMYVAGLQPGSYTVSMGGAAPAGSAAAGIGGGIGGIGPSGQSTLAEIQGMLAAARDAGPSVLERYQTGLTGVR
jgi:hypothetical protein